VVLKKNKYLSYIINPLGLITTKKVVQVNPTIIPERKNGINQKISVIEYDAVQYFAKESSRVEDTFEHLTTNMVSWINIDGINKTEIEKLSKHYNIHNLIVEDILSIGQRPKMDDIEGRLFCVLNMLYFNEKDASIETEQISIVLGNNFVISIQEDEQKDVFNSLRERIKLLSSKPRQHKADFLFYAMIDAIVDQYFLVMERLGEKIEQLEEEVIKHPSNKSLVKINNIRKEMILLKRSIGPVRELIHGILRSENELIEEKTEKYFKDIYDHIIQANDLAENYRDLLINIHDLYMSNVNLKMNEIMKIMAIVTCLLAPATVIGGIFGMNFERLPLLHDKRGFFIDGGLMIIIPFFMVVYFKRRRWF
jgi:magnesium transporter